MPDVWLNSTRTHSLIVAPQGTLASPLLFPADHVNEIIQAGLAPPSPHRQDGADGSTLEDNLFELKNGCICCTVKDDLVTTLETLLQRRSKFDYIIIETTGLANPVGTASCFGSPLVEIRTGRADSSRAGIDMRGH